MKVLIANHTSRLVGGAERYLSGVSQALRDRGLEVRLLTEEPSDERSDPRTFASTRTETREEFERWAPDVAFVQGLLQPSLEGWIVDRFASVLFAHNYYGTCISGEKRTRRPDLAFCTRRFGAACLLLYWPLGCGPSSPRALVKGYRLQAARNGLLSRYREIVVGSQHMKAEMERNTSSRVTLAPLFVEDRAAAPSRSRRPSSFVFVGRMTAVKGGQLAVRAVANLQSSLGVPIALDFVGSGPEEAGWKRLASSAGVEARFHGWLDATARDAIIQESCALVLPSIWPEPFGLVRLEAARLGVPSVAFDAGGIRDWLENGVTGALCPVSHDLIASLTAGLRRAREDLMTENRWGEAAYQGARRFALARHVEVLREVFERVSGTRA